MKITRKNIFLGLLVTGIILLSGFYAFSYLRGDDIKPNKVIYQRPGYDNLPWEIKNWIENSKEIFLSQKRLFEGKTYILVTWGEKPTAGYSIEIDELFYENNKLVVSVLLESPALDDMVAQVITYPYDLIVIDYEVGEIEFRFK